MKGVYRHADPILACADDNGVHANVTGGTTVISKSQRASVGRRPGSMNLTVELRDNRQVAYVCTVCAELTIVTGVEFCTSAIIFMQSVPVHIQ